MGSRSWDIRIIGGAFPTPGTGFMFSGDGGLKPGRAITEPGEPIIGTIEIPSFHHGPGQVVARDPQQYLRGVHADTSRRGMVLPAGEVSLFSTSAAAEFDQIHGARFCQVNGHLFVVVPEHIYEITHGNPDTVGAAVYTPPAGTKLTGSWARWRGEVIFATEKAPASPIGGDSTNRYAEQAEPVVYDISGDSFSDPVPASAKHHCSHIVSGRGQLWWAQNRGKFAAPEIYWTDDTENPWNSIAAADIYGPFRIEQGGYCTNLHLAGPHILVFKRDGSIIGVDESKIWVPYTPHRGYIEDDYFGHAMAQYLGFIAVNEKNGAFLFAPNTLEIQSVEPSHVQGYTALTDEHLMGKLEAFAVRGTTELFALGKTANGVALLTGVSFPGDNFYFSSDYGVYAVESVVSGGSPFIVRDPDGGSYFRDNQYFRDIAAPTVFTETPRAAEVYESASNQHLYIAHEGDGDQKLKLYRIDLATPDWRLPPETVSVGGVYSSQYAGAGALAGVTKIPVQVRGYTNLDTGTIYIGVGLDGQSEQAIGAVSTTGPFALPLPSNLRDVAGRTVSVRIGWLADDEFRLELPLWIDVLYNPSTEDTVTVNVAVGDVAPAIKSQTLTHARHLMEQLIDLEKTVVTLEFYWGTTWSVWVEKVSARQVQGESVANQGTYVVQLQCRRIS